METTRPVMTVIRRTGLALLLWLLVVAACLLIIGAAVFPLWWKRFLLGGGILHTSFWADKLSSLGHAVGSFSPLGAALIGFGTTVLVTIIYFLGHRSAAAQDLGLLPAPPRAVLVAVVVPTLFVFASLFFMRGDYWTEAESRRSLDSFIREMGTGWLPPPLVSIPPSGTFLYIDRETALEQYAVLSDSLAVTSETMKEAGESKTGITGAIPSVGSVGVERKKIAETSVTRTAPPVTPAVAVTRLIEKFVRDKDVPVLIQPYRWEYKGFVEVLTKRGVTLSKEQKAQLEKYELEQYEAKTLQSRERRPFFFRGLISIVPGKKTAELIATVGRPLEVTVSGRLKLEYLGPHIQHCIKDGRASCKLAMVTLFGVMETVESISARARKVTVLPVAIW